MNEHLYTDFFKSTDDTKHFTKLATFTHSYTHSYADGGGYHPELYKAPHDVPLLRHSHTYTDGTDIGSSLGFGILFR